MGEFIFLTLCIAFGMLLVCSACVCITAYGESKKAKVEYDWEETKRLADFLAAWEENDTDDYYGVVAGC